MDRRFPELAPAVRRRLLTEAAGNPPALLEPPSALDGDQRADFTALPDVLPLPERLQAMFTTRVRDLPERCRLMLLPDGGQDMYVAQELYRNQFAADVPEETTRVMASTQRPIAAGGGAVGPVRVFSDGRARVRGPREGAPR